MKNRQAIGSAYFCFTLAGISGIIKTIFGIVVSVTIPTIYVLLGKKIGVKTYASTWCNLTSVAIGFVWPSSLDMSATYSYYTYRKCISMSNKTKKLLIKNKRIEALNEKVFMPIVLHIGLFIFCVLGCSVCCLYVQRKYTPVRIFDYVDQCCNYCFGIDTGILCN